MTRERQVVLNRACAPWLVGVNKCGGTYIQMRARVLVCIGPLRQVRQSVSQFPLTVKLH